MAECITLENGLRVETFHVEPCTCTNAQLHFEELRKNPEYVKEYEKLSRHGADCQCMRCDEC